MSSLDVTSRQDLIVGCGYLGRRVARRWLASRRQVAALTRRNADRLSQLGIRPIVGDVLDGAGLGQLPEAGTVLYAVGFDRFSGRSMQEVYVLGLANVLAALPRCNRFLYVSSTSVYGQADGGIVDENSPTEPIDEAGRIVLQAEELLWGERPDSIILRFGGIYGPDRLLRRQAQFRSPEPLSGEPDRWLNLVHVEDGADAVLAAESFGEPGATYNIVDDEPMARHAFYSQLAELVGAPAPRFDHRADTRASHRRVSNAKAKTTLGWRPSHPSYREGLPAAIRESTE